jgi:2-iminoacetate synthase ThiH
MNKPELISLIEEAGFEAVERDTLYRAVTHEAVIV